jgi:hypothetical protein
LRTDGIIFPFELNDIMDDKQKIKSLKQNYDYIFKKIVDAKLARNESKARTYAIELLEVKKEIKEILIANVTFKSTIRHSGALPKGFETN